MAIARVITYECKECGSEIVVTETGETLLSPIYCCSVAVIETSSVEKKQIQAKPKKKTANKVAKQSTKKEAAKKKKPAAKKKLN